MVAPEAANNAAIAAVLMPLLLRCAVVAVLVLAWRARWLRPRHEPDAVVPA